MQKGEALVGDEPLTLLWIPFRSADHALWFMLTMFQCCLVALTCTISLYAKQYTGARLLSLGFATSSFLVCTEAYFKTNGGTIVVPGYSVDCIWYNGMLALIFLLVFQTFSQLRSEQARTRRKK